MSNKIARAIEDMGIDEPVMMFVNPTYEEALVGITGDNRLVFMYEDMIDCLTQHDKISREDAIEYIDYNIIGFHVGAKEPIIVYRMELDDDSR